MVKMHAVLSYLNLQLLCRILLVTVMGKYESPVSSELAARMKSIRRPKENGNRFELYLRLMDLYTRLELFLLAESILSNHLRRIFGFPERLSLRFLLAACLRIPA